MQAGTVDVTRVWHFWRCIRHHRQVPGFCNNDRRMSDSFDYDAKFKRPGHYPHLRRIDQEPCPEIAKAILLGASNSWFSVSLSARSIPLATDRLSGKSRPALPFLLGLLLFHCRYLRNSSYSISRDRTVQTLNNKHFQQLISRGRLPKCLQIRTSPSNC